MARSKRERYETARGRIEQEVSSGNIDREEADLILEFCNAKDPQSHAVTDPSGSTKADATLARYANLLRRIKMFSAIDLCDTTAYKLNVLMDRLQRGDPDGVKDEGLAAGTIKNYQTTLRKFYEYHSGLGIGKEEITLANPDTQSIDERDIFDKEDIKALRNAPTDSRDKALIDLLLYTGQRISAILNLRLKDINLEEGTFYLNEERGDLKNASGKRPLLLAEKAVRDWYHDHPYKGSNPNAFFITHKDNWEGKSYEAGDRLDSSSVYRQLQRIGDMAGVEKPVNAHNFRHTFVTVCKRNYGMDNSTIKRLIGHRPDSNIMETTYTHLTDEDVIAAAERAADLRDDEPESPLTPDVCDVCGAVTHRDDAKACPGCGTIFTPDAHVVEELLDGKMTESYKETDPEDDATHDDIERLEELIEDPRVKRLLLQRIEGLQE